MNVRNVAAALAAALLAAGCGGGGPAQVRTEAAPKPALERAKLVLTGYAGGQPVGSEAADFGALAADVRQSDPAKGELLEKGLAAIKANPGQASAKAKELLGKL